MPTNHLSMYRIVFLLAAASVVASLHAADPIDREELVAKINDIAAEALREPGGVGLSIAVARGDETILAEGYGAADLEHQAPMTKRSMLRIGSVTKQYTAALVLKLADEGLLSLDDPITMYVDYPVGEHAITIRHLLNHTSGLPSYTGIEEFWSQHAARDLSDDEMLALVQKRPFDFAPGERFLYNNTGYYMLGMVIEKVTGQGYADALKSHLLEPLGLEETRYDIGAEIVPHRARGYTVLDGRIANAAPIGMRNPGAAGGMIATAADLVRWQQALVSGSVISDTSWTQMISPTELADGSSHPYGYGIALSNHHERTCYSHGGGINGFSSMLMYFPDDELHVAVIANSEVVLTGRIALRIAAATLGIKEGALEDLPVAQPLLDRMAGTYRLEQIGLDIRFWAVEDRLHAQATGQPEIRLLHAGSGVFRATFDPSLRMTFPVAIGETDEPFPTFTLQQAGMSFEARRVHADDADAPAAAPDDLPLPQTVLERIAGRYRLEQIGLEIRFRAKDGRLHMQAVGQPEIPLQHQGDGVFGTGFDPSLRLSFPVAEGDGRDAKPFQSFTFHQRGMAYEATRLPTE